MECLTFFLYSVQNRRRNLIPKHVFQSGLVLMDALLTFFERHCSWPKGVYPMWRTPTAKSVLFLKKSSIKHALPFHGIIETLTGSLSSSPTSVLKQDGSQN